MLTFNDLLLRIALSVFLSSVIGLERERKGRAAGLRTHILVSLGSCLIMLVSIHIFEVYKDMTTVDPGRIAAGVVTGIGFLGAGTIIRSGDSVRGLTTAATIWFSSAIGLACGCGFFYGAAISAVMALIVLLFLLQLENLLKK